MITNDLYDVCKTWREADLCGRKKMGFVMNDVFCDAGYPNIGWFYFGEDQEAVKENGMLHRVIGVILASIADKRNDSMDTRFLEILEDTIATKYPQLAR